MFYVPVDIDQMYITDIHGLYKNSGYSSLTINNDIVNWPNEIINLVNIKFISAFCDVLATWLKKKKGSRYFIKDLK